MESLFFVDCEAPFGVGSPAVGDMTRFGAAEYHTRQPFYGKDCSRDTFAEFDKWVRSFPGRPVFISDNVAYDWQWINFYFWRYMGGNPFGHSARRIGDFYAGLARDFRKTQEWKRFRVTKHDHNPVHDAMGNAEAFARMVSATKTPDPLSGRCDA